MSNAMIEWRRLLVEGVVILVSILLAFGIDAWWEDRQENQEALRQVDRVLAELEANTVILDKHVAWMKAATAATAEFLAICGPDPQPITSAAMGKHFDGIFGVPTLSVSRNATEQFLASGRLTLGEWTSVRQELASLQSQWQEEERDSLELRRFREPIMERAGKLIPGLTTSLQHPAMSKYQASKFPFDSTALLSDRQFEGHLATYAIRLELNLRDLIVLIELHEALAEKIKGIGET